MTECVYLVMFEDITIAAFTTKDSKIDTLKVNDGYNSFLPFECQTKNELIKWLYERSVPVTRKGIKRELGNLSPFEFMLENRGLSLTDHYWVKKFSEEYQWQSLNCYTNMFKEKYSLQLKSDKITDIRKYSFFTPSASLKGDLQKKWIINEEGIRLLIKGNTSDIALQSISEVFASLLHSKQQINEYVNYQFIRVPVIENSYSGVLGCMCQNFTDINSQFISAAQMFSHTRNSKSMTDMFSIFLELCVNVGLDRQYVRDYLDYMIMTDFLITNMDRHLNNFGVLQDTTTMRITSLAPIFDSGNSLSYGLSYVPQGKQVLNIESRLGFTQNELANLKGVLNRNLVDITKLPTVNELKNLLDMDEVMSEQHKEKICNLYKAKVYYFDIFQQGKSVYELSKL